MQRSKQRVNHRNTRCLTHALQVSFPFASSSSRLLLPTTPTKLLELSPSHTAPNTTRGPPLIFHGGGALWGVGLKGHENARWRVFKAESSEKLKHWKNRGSGEYRPPYRLDGTWIATPASSAEEMSEAPVPVILC